MKRSVLEKQIASIPAEYIGEVSEFINYILYKAKENKSNSIQNTARYFGCVPRVLDGLNIQREMRNEWD